jgi:hypothetical protein
MWRRADFHTLIGTVPVPVAVKWDARPFALKYGLVNSLLAVICTFYTGRLVVSPRLILPRRSPVGCQGDEDATPSSSPQEG